MKKLLLLASLLFAVSSPAQPSSGPFIRPLPFISITPGPSGANMAPLMQATMDMMTNPALSDVFSGVRGGKIMVANGTFLLFTNLTIPNYWPYCLRLEGAGFNGTLFEGRGADGCTNLAMFNCATNAINGLATSNALTLFVSDMGFCHTNQTQTNFLWDVVGQSFCSFENCMFTTKYALQNGQAGYSLNYEHNVPNSPIGLVGLAASKGGDNANCELYVKHCLFYALASGVVMNPVIARIDDSYFANCGGFSTTLPPSIPDASHWFSHTNIWRGNNPNYPGWISSGAAIVIGNNTPNIWVTKNVFFSCGAMAAVGLDGNAGPGGHIIRFKDNYNVTAVATPTFASTSYHILTADSASITCTEDNEGVDFPPMIDSLCTNGLAGNPTAQPNAVAPTVPIPTLRLSHSGTGLDGDSYFLLDGGGGNKAPRLIANGAGITNGSAQGIVTNFTTYAVGTAYTLTGTSAALDFGTTDPVLTINQTGTYKISGKVGVKYVGATYAGAQTVTFKFRRTNNTAADLTSGSRAVELPVLTTFTGGDVMDLPDIVYTATSGDTITIFGILSATPAAGSVTTDSADLMAIRLY